MRLIPALLLCALAACAGPVAKDMPAAVVPAAEAEQAELPTGWTHAVPTSPASTSPWWQAYQDATLNNLVERALLANPDIRLAEARLGEIGKIVATADPDEQAAAQAARDAAVHDAGVIRQAAVHAVTTAYLETRLARQRMRLLQQRVELDRELVSGLQRRQAAGLANAEALRDQELAVLETHQTRTRARHDQRQALVRLAALVGEAPVGFSLPDGEYPATGTLQPAIAPPASVIERRQDVQAAWKRLMAAREQGAEDDTDASTRIEHVEAAGSVRNAAYRQSVLSALQEVESAIDAWQAANADYQHRQDMLQTQCGQVSGLERAVTAGRSSRLELLKARIAENTARENLLLAAHARNLAFAALQLALGQT